MMNFKALFIVPSQKKVYGANILPAYPPLGILYVSSAIEKLGVEVRILDMDIDKVTLKYLASFIKEFKPNIIGFTGTTPLVNNALELAGQIKEFCDTPIVLGGIHATMNAHECIKHPAVDFVVVGEGENTMKELISEIHSGKPNFNRIKGLMYKVDKGAVFTGEAPLIENLDALPFPAKHLLNNFTNYLPPDAEHLPVSSIMTTRGCVGKCTYCCTKNIFKDKYRMRSIDNVLEEIEYNIQRFKVKEIHFADDALNVSRERTLKLCEEIRKRRYKINFEFLNGLRADNIDNDILDAFKGIGIKNLGFGAESADINILRNVDKNIMPQQVVKAMGMAKKKGFKTWVYFMFGLPGETEETIKKTIKFAKDIDPDFVKFLIFKPFPGSKIFNEFRNKNLIDDFNWDNYGVYTPPVHHLENLPASKLLYWEQRGYREFYFRPKKIWGHIKRQKSLTQLRLTFKSFLFVCARIFNLGDKKR